MANFLSPKFHFKLSKNTTLTPYNTTKFHKAHDEINLEQYLEVGKYPSYLLGIVLIL